VDSVDRDPDARARLAAAQQRLVASLVAGAPPPPGFDPERLAAVAAALLRKRAGVVAGVWPRLAAAFGAEWTTVFAGWAAGRPPRGALRDGFDFARVPARRHALTPSALAELAIREAQWAYDGVGAVRRRRLPAVRRFSGGAAVGVLGRVVIGERWRIYLR
jgi:hypothetical protein